MNREELIKKYEEKGTEAFKETKIDYYNACKDFLYDLRYNFEMD